MDNETCVGDVSRHTTATGENQRQPETLRHSSCPTDEYQIHSQVHVSPPSHSRVLSPAQVSGSVRSLLWAVSLRALYLRDLYFYQRLCRCISSAACLQYIIKCGALYIIKPQVQYSPKVLMRYKGGTPPLMIYTSTT